MNATVSSSEPSLGDWLTRVSVLSTATYLIVSSSKLQGFFLGTVVALSCVTPLAISWLLTVTGNVPEPYLDEVFHIPQAQVYCEGRYYEWDDKITTPPGLARLTPNLAKPNTSRQVTTYDILTGVNVALFPVLFFFSGLYYTDPASTLIVLLAYANHLTRVGANQPSFLNDIYSLGLGILTLGFRQTNIFWVVVYTGGLEVIHALKTLNPAPVETLKFQTVSDQIRFYAWRYSLGDIHDPSLSLAQPAASIGIAAVCNLPLVLRRFIWPHGVVLTSFIAFVAWNGGVVLGDKSNHVATIHLAQMLYIWPFFAFFSAPLFIPQLLNLAITVYRTFTFHNIFSIRKAITAIVGCGTLAIAFLIVRFNTIIHPFTLADNRHYVFYVFRYSILRSWWIRYALAPVYVICAWLCWGALQSTEVSQEKWIRSPFISTPPKTIARPNKGKESPAQGNSKVEVEIGEGSPATSTVLMLLLATSLSLMTAPLVEPRYFILPWVFWRLLVPTTPVPSLFSPSRPEKSRQGSSNYLTILILEAGWFILINAATMYIFVTRPFYWRAPDGTLQDEGRVQRFMW
ncbi:hypothetical protein FHL15_010906 [Xylaria flabelliformis]|uniref:Dol-P-Glc:Glc(2)Man(9)GlcNAc(2)-PP-Dol alpha-1,2-glucosyltransferase n=1 Tax=Xylaria flabelliformis TaxID=2512241 RepID=A0A553HJU3_9PEZI|nr:hypothetical protein FHL15_010906 [Xylaria flabelliformis]